MNICSKCTNKPICKIADYIKSLEPHNVLLGVNYCNFQHVVVGAPNKEEVKKVLVDPLEKLGLGKEEEKILPVTDKEITSNLPEGDAKYCPSCKKLVPVSEFTGKRCVTCKQEICEDCVIYSDGDAYCEDCF